MKIEITKTSGDKIKTSQLFKVEINHKVSFYTDVNGLRFLEEMTGMTVNELTSMANGNGLSIKQRAMLAGIDIKISKFKPQ